LSTPAAWPREFNDVSRAQAGTLRASHNDMLEDARVLVADDDPLLLATIADALTHLGARVIRATSGAELIEQLASEGPFDLVVTDVSMPWMDGLQAMHAIRTAGLATPVIVVTALTDDRIPAQVRALGDKAMLLRKPFDLEEFMRAAASLLERSSATTHRGSQP
jgi:CheY-like chemotaxis protein